MNDFEVVGIDPSQAGRVIELESQYLESIGLEADELSSNLPDITDLESELHYHPAKFLGVYVASQLVAFSLISPWHSEDDMPFMANAMERNKVRMRGMLGRYIVKPVGVHRIAVDQELNSTDHYRATHGIVRGITDFADALDVPVNTVVFDPAHDITLPHLINHDFKATQHRILDSDGEVISAKFTRDRRTSIRGKKVRNLAMPPRISPAANFNTY